MSTPTPAPPRFGNSLSWFLRNSSGKTRLGWKLLAFSILIPSVGIGQDWLLRRLNHGVYPSLPFGLGDLVVVLLPTWLFLRLEQRHLASIGLRLNLHWFRDLSLGFLLACSLMLVAAAGAGFTQGGWIRTSLGIGALLQGFSHWTGVALFEELVFRGYPFQRMVETWGAKTTQALMAALFVLPHLWTGLRNGYPVSTLLLASVNIGCGALFMGLAFLRTRSLALPIGIHLGWNWMQGTVLGLGVSGGTRPSFLRPAHPGPAPIWLTGGPYGPEASLPGILAAMIGIAVLGIFLPSPGVMEQGDPGLPPTSARSA